MHCDPVGARRRRHIVASLEIEIPVAARAAWADDKVLGATDEESISRHSPVCSLCNRIESDRLVRSARRHVYIQILFASISHDKSDSRAIDKVARGSLGTEQGLATNVLDIQMIDGILICTDLFANAWVSGLDRVG